MKIEVYVGDGKTRDLGELIDEIEREAGWWFRLQVLFWRAWFKITRAIPK